jgi:transcriptional regulator with XRE-family HTH domain
MIIMIHKNLQEYLNAGTDSEKNLAGKLGVSVSYVNMIKRGTRRPSPELAEKIEKATGIPFRLLLFPSNNLG